MKKKQQRKSSPAPKKQRPAPARRAARAAPPESPAPEDWRTSTLARVRALIAQADPAAIEEVKWRKPSNAMQGVPVWSHDAILCTGETYKDKIKLTFAKGASLDDPAGLFNASLDAGTRRAIDLREGDTLDERAFKDLIRAAVALNTPAPRALRRKSPTG